MDKKQMSGITVWCTSLEGVITQRIGMGADQLFLNGG